MMIRRIALSALLLAAPSFAAAQQSTADQIKRAIEMYNAFNIEGARPILMNIISPQYLLSVKPEERVSAYKYLGASYAVLDRRDSAVTFFTAALDFDPFTDLDPREFSASELNAFAEAKQRIFKIGIRPVTPRILDTTFSFRLITSHRSDITVELIRQSDTTQKQILYQGANDGPREVPWSGRMRSGVRADSVLYEVRMRGRSLAGTGSTAESVDRQLFKIEYVFEPLEDTLPALLATELLQEQYKASAPWADLAKGTALAVVAAGLPLLALASDKEDLDWIPHAAAASGIGLGSAVFTFSYRRRNRQIPQNVAENRRRQAQRTQFNTGVRARNEDRINRMTMLICPAGGCPR